VYKHIHEDEDCIIVLMDAHESTLAHYISPAHPLSPRLWAEIMRGLAERLYTIHSVGKVHGDLKPSNGTYTLPP
jgi:serine/threonine protein kinase